MSTIAVARQFSRAAQSYSDEARVQAMLSAQILRRVLWQSHHGVFRAAAQPRRILDIGCGSGELTAALAAHWPEAEIDALDIAPKMIETAAKRHVMSSNISWHCADFMQWEARSACYDLIVSNAAIQWMMPVQNAAQHIAECLSDTGIVLCSSIMRGSLAELHSARSVVAPERASVVELPSVEECLFAFANAQLRMRYVRKEVVREHFSSAAAAFRHLKRSGVTGASAPSAKKSLTPRELRAVSQAYEHSYPNADLPLSYHTLLVELVAGKE